MRRAPRLLRYPSLAVRGFSEVRRPPFAPKPLLDIRHIRRHPELYAQTCRERNYPEQVENADRIVVLYGKWEDGEKSTLVWRKRARDLSSAMAGSPGNKAALEKARAVKEQLLQLASQSREQLDEMEALALQLPSLTSEDTPRGPKPVVADYVNKAPASFASKAEYKSHVDIGAELGILDLAAGAKTSGWGWYYLIGDGARLEQALVQYALSVASRRGWTLVSPPSIVYSHIGAACGFQPRDRHGETQIYKVAQSSGGDTKRRAPELILGGTSEIALAGIKADSTINAADLPLRRVAVSRCYRAEAGSRGASTKGIYRVHEFTKVELFAWTAPDAVSARRVLNDMVDMQKELLAGLGLYCRVLIMPVADLGAAATYKVDIEAFFPGRRRLASSIAKASSKDAKASPKGAKPASTASSQDDDASPKTNSGWGEVTSASLCSDYQTRRLATRLRPEPTSPDTSLEFPFTANATALAVPRVLAALLENGWDNASRTVAIPKCLRPWMDGKERIGPPAGAQ
ncbi:hypothetical protein CDD81_6266 [Ophiocordyceps australis]|uniref:serine--tRNA ligase n=1 Tax=Ophiocordyceps australis TaxID=1399860 RepID=A0A2C5Y0U6_9HYPO|nr:hypothetical protein CDD81_6266 [Ophiocordyceps australis]